MGNIFVAGSINMDIVTRMAHLPRPGETVFGQELHYIPGGKGSNQAVAASRLGNNVHLVGKLGRDAFGQALTDFLRKEKINLDFLFYSDMEPTGIVLINVDGRSENSIVVVSGSNYHLSQKDVDKVDLKQDDVVVSVFEIPQPTIKHIFQQTHQANAITILTPAPAAEFVDGLLELVDYLIVNETELAFFSNRDQVSNDIDTIVHHAKQLRQHPEQSIIVTLGAKGLVCINDGQVIQIDGIPVDTVDTTGAGDCFAGAFSVAISEQMPLEDALAFANKAAAISVQYLGVSNSFELSNTIW